MSWLNRRTLMEYTCNYPPDIEIKEITLYKDFEPNGQAFSDDTIANKSSIDLKSNSTFYTEINLLDTTTLSQNLISIGGNDISSSDGRNNGYPRSVIHIYLSAANKISVIATYRTSSSASRVYRTADLTISGTTVKVAINDNGIIINGSYINVQDAQKTIITEIYNSSPTGILVGACNTAWNFSNQHYNKVSFLPQFLTTSEMVTLTTV